MVALTLQELAEGFIDHSKVTEGQCLKPCNVTLYGFENDGVQKNKKKGYHPLFGQKMHQFKLRIV